MSPHADEMTLATVFADVRHVFSRPDRTPVHDRFEKGSYVYLYHDLAQDGARLEMANNAGTKEQDAFSGLLQEVKIVYSYKQPLVFSITIPDTAHRVEGDWRIPHWDLRHEKKYMYPIRALDIYVWSPTEAAELLDALKKVVSQGMLAINDRPPNPPGVEEPVSPIIQRFEQIAVDTPVDLRQCRTESTGTAQSILVPQLCHLPDPFVSNPQDFTFAPIAAYNPAAPVAPEPIAHREKTPPPLDGAEGTGLGAAATHDHPGTTFTNGYQHLMPAWQYQPSTPSYLNNQTFSPRINAPPMHFPLPPPPSLPANLPQPMAYALPPPPQSTTNTTPSVYTFAGPPILQEAPSFGAPPRSSKSMAPSVSNPQSRFPSQIVPIVPSFGPPPTAATSSHEQLPQTPPQQCSPAALRTPAFSPANITANGIDNGDCTSPEKPIGGYSNYSYASTPPQSAHTQQAQDAHTIHASLYRPTPEELKGHAKKTGASPGKFEVKADKLEKGVNKWLKRLDKGW